MSNSGERVEIRPIRIEDAEAVAGLCGELGYPAEVGAIEQRIRFLTGAGRHAIFVACPGPEIVAGWIDVGLEFHLQSEPSAVIGGLVVGSAFRRAGIGQALVKQAEAWARESRIAQLRVRSNVVRRDTHRFYLRRGFAVKKTSTVFEKSLPAEGVGTEAL